jgi:hypothetical protein
MWGSVPICYVAIASPEVSGDSLLLGKRQLACQHKYRVLPSELQSIGYP